MADLWVAARVAARGLDVRCAVAAGEVLAVLGPNGAGKSTLAGVIAGLAPADHGVVRVGRRLLTETTAGVHVPAHHRRVGLLLQDPLLFPHLNARDNVAFGSRFGTRPPRSRREARATAERWLEQVGVGDLAGRKPGRLSGGEIQRVAIARALAAEPDVLILDEPLSGLDVAAAAAVRTTLRAVAAGSDRATVLITHDLADVLALADRVLVMEAGAVAEEGPAVEVLAAPRSRFGARIAGLNLVRGTMRSPVVLRDQAGRDWHGTPAQPLSPGREAVAVFPPAAVAVYRDEPHGSPRNVTAGRIAAVETGGAGVRVRLAAGPGGVPGLAADVTAAAVAELRLAPGEQVWFSVKSQAVHLHPATRALVR